MPEERLLFNSDSPCGGDAKKETERRPNAKKKIGRWPEV